MVVRVKTVVVGFQPPDTYGGFVSNIANPVLNEFSHFLILDGDTVCDFSVDNIAQQFGSADIVGFNVISSSRTFRLWEKMTYWLKHSVMRQVSDGKFRAELRYPFWKTLVHSVFRVRPFVLLSYVFHRFPKER